MYTRLELLLLVSKCYKAGILKWYLWLGMEQSLVMVAVVLMMLMFRVLTSVGCVHTWWYG